MAEGQDPAQGAAEVIAGRVLFWGRVMKKEWESREGYMFGTTTLQGTGADSGHSFKVWFKNENHVTYRDEKPFVTSPDLIAIINTRDGEPHTNTTLEEGMEVAVLGARANEKYRRPEGLSLLGPRYFGFDIDYVPIEKVCPGR
jgi:DUF917 family protein